MASKSIDQWKTNLLKFALSAKDAVELEKYTNVRASDVHVMTDPFPHVVIENTFKPETYNALCDQFNEVKARGLSKEKKNYQSQFHAFDMDYDGYVYVPAGVDDPSNPLALFYSLQWNKLFSKIFGQFTTFETTLAFHHHPKGDKTGFVHDDNVDKRFLYSLNLSNGVIYSKDGPFDHVCRRSIAILYYLNNEPWHEGDGGETAIFAADGKTIVKKIPPINNTLFAFQISNKSMHAFQGNMLERNSFVQWFHTPPELL